MSPTGMGRRSICSTSRDIFRARYPHRKRTCETRRLKPISCTASSCGGNRIELFGDTGYLIFDPDWKTVVWNVANEIDLEKSSIWFGSQLAKSFYRYGTPVVPGRPDGGDWTLILSL